MSIPTVHEGFTSIFIIPLLNFIDTCPKKLEAESRMPYYSSGTSDEVFIVPEHPSSSSQEDRGHVTHATDHVTCSQSTNVNDESMPSGIPNRLKLSMFSIFFLKLYTVKSLCSQNLRSKLFKFLTERKSKQNDPGFIDLHWLAVHSPCSEKKSFVRNIKISHIYIISEENKTLDPPQSSHSMCVWYIGLLWRSQQKISQSS